MLHGMDDDEVLHHAKKRGLDKWEAISQSIIFVYSELKWQSP